MASSAKELPLDILMRIFGFLPVPSVCRLRAVCKQWNALIDSPEFGTLCALAPRQRFYVLLTPGRCRNADAGWCVLDVMDERFYSLDSSYLVDHAKKANPCGDETYSLETVDTAGGLFLVAYREKHVLPRFNVLYVCHPVTKTLKRLPPIVGMAYELTSPILTVDYSAKTYKVICIGEQMHMYDSQNGQWSELATPPDRDLAVCSAVCNNTVYTIFGKRSCHMLLTYSLIDDAWSKEGAELPYNSFEQLVVVNGEVYLVAGSRTSCFCGQEMCLKSCIIVSKVAPPPKAPEKIARMPETWHTLLYPPNQDWNNCYGIPSFIAVASECAIVFTSTSGRCIVYDLANRSWRSVQKRHHYNRKLAASSTTLNPGFLL
ncbi:F-box only protein 6 [Physcomitrium patens]|uniref:F-box domain-containing protein n=1 Tax=Physcomitrium patens TaxID=3218 RepID=A9SAY7_PHYPA|nr:F-box/kelch-repeat protein At3g61590-like [Physcomitrium patens]PNR45088.1 hypothetical protein PHYPA_014859 [Physcomitrium patens]|eukprot:XP_024389797.1 F-box/kelch-repeat protein At3g61590-like [Physcomitrella patens]